MTGQDRMKADIFSKYWAVILLSALLCMLIAILFTMNWPASIVTVHSVPAGAILTTSSGFNYVLPADIPVSSEGLAASISYPGRLRIDTLLQPTDTSSISIVLPYIFPVEITSEPSGAIVYIDSVSYGITPLTANIEAAGTHILELVLNQNIVLLDSFTVISNKVVHRHYLLPELLGNNMLIVPDTERVIVLSDSKCIPDRSEGNGDSYLISIYEVTNHEFCEYLKHLEPNPDSDSTWRWGRTDLVEDLFPGDYPIPFRIDQLGQWSVIEGLEDYPVAGMSVQAAIGYCSWLTDIDPTDTAYRLPTEDEWTYAALAGGSGPYPWGADRPDGTLLNLSDSQEGMLNRHPSIDDGFPTTAPVASYKPNDWGLYDMAGNVWEWCISADSATYVAKGGSWLSSMDDCMCEARFLPDTTLGFPFVGFRIAAAIIGDGGINGD